MSWSLIRSRRRRFVRRGTFEALEQRVLMTYVDMLNHGPSANRVDVVFVGDGYTTTDLAQGTYTTHIQSMLDHLFNDAEEPFVRYANFFNVHRIDVVSAESGVTTPQLGITRNTALQSTYRYDGTIDRLLYLDTTLADTVVSQELQGASFTAEIPIAVANSSVYGGGGGEWAVYAGGNASAPEVALHELGHSFAGLADEYGGDTGTYSGPEPSQVDVTTDPSGAKWSRWQGYTQAGLGTVGAYEGGAYFDHGIYRPTNNSKMRSLNRPFDAIAREAFVLAIYQFVNPLDSFTPTSATLNAPSSISVTPVDTSVIGVDWYVDGQRVLQDGSTSVTPAALGLAPGNYSVEARAYDRAITSSVDWVRTRQSELTQTVTWQVSIPDVAPKVTLTSSSSSVTNTSPIPITATFSEAVTGFDLGDVAVANGTVSGFAGSGTTYTFLVTPSAQGAVTVSVGAGKGIDAVGNANSASVPLIRTFDSVAPRVLNVSSAAANATYRGGAILDLTVTFSETVAVTGTPRLMLETGVTDRPATCIGGSGTNVLKFRYVVQSGDVSADLNYTSTTALTLNGGTIRDAASNGATLSLPGLSAAGSLGVNKALVIDALAPRVTNVTSPNSNGAYRAGNAIDVAVTFSEAVSVTGTPQVRLETGAIDRTANYIGGSGTNTLTFRYAIQAGDASSDLNYTSTTALILNGGTIRDTAGNAAISTLPGTAAAGSLGVSKNLVVDTAAPIVTLASSAAAVTRMSPIPVTVTFNEPVVGFTASDVAVVNGAVSGFGGTGKVYTFVVIPQGQGTVLVNLAAGRVTDAAGNANLAAATLSRTFDSVASRVTNVTSTKANGAYRAGSVIDVSVTFNEVVKVTGSPLLRLETGVTDQAAGYLGGSGTSTLTFRYTVQPGDVSRDLNYTSTTSLGLNGGTIRDVALNSAVLTLPALTAAGSLGVNKALVVDTAGATVGQVTSAVSNGTYGAGSIIDITVTFNESVLVTGAPLLRLETGATDRAAGYLSGSGTKLLTFRYTVQPGDSSDDLNYTSTTALSLNGGTIRDVAQNAALLTLPGVASPGALGVNKNLVIRSAAASPSPTPFEGSGGISSAAIASQVQTLDAFWTGSAGDVTDAGLAAD